MKDNIFNTENNNIGDFVFDKNVADVFDNMINRSVPGYSAIINMLGFLSEKYVKDNTNCYDLGCSLGEGTISISKGAKSKKCEIIAVDNSSAMVEKCAENFKQHKMEHKIKLICEDICNIDIKNASLVVLNLVLQFLPLDQREALLDKISKGINDGGILFLTEKIAFEDDSEESFQTENYYNYKKLNGYSELEISQKRTALEKVLIPETMKTHKQRLLKAGFRSVYKWFQCFNFISMVAIK